MLAASFAEILSIGAVLPFLAVLTNPDRIFQLPSARPFINFIGFTSPDQLLLPLTIVFAIAAIISGAMRLLLLWVSTRISFAIGSDLSIGIYLRTLYQPYSVHVGRNSSKVMSGISGKANTVITGIIVPSLTIISSSTLLIVIVLTLVTIEPVIALTAFGGFGLIYAIIIRFTQSRMLINSQSIASGSTQLIKSLQEGLGGIRDILINGCQTVFCQIYRNADIHLRRAQGNSSFIGQFPRFGIEPLGMLIIAALSYLLARQPDGIAKAIPILGAIVLGAQRLLPVMQSGYASWNSIQSGQVSLIDILELLDQPLPEYVGKPPAKPLPFQQQIKLIKLSFRYTPKTPWILKNLDLAISKGSRIGFIGLTGSGKSTLLDILMGLLHPNEGSLEVDNQEITKDNTRQWQAHIASVPQAIFLADSTIRENIAFGVPINKIDPALVKKAAEQAQIADILKPGQKNTTPS